MAIMAIFLSLSYLELFIIIIFFFNYKCDIFT